MRSSCRVIRWNVFRLRFYRNIYSGDQLKLSLTVTARSSDNGPILRRWDAVSVIRATLKLSLSPKNTGSHMLYLWARFCATPDSKRNEIWFHADCLLSWCSVGCLERRSCARVYYIKVGRKEKAMVRWFFFSVGGCTKLKLENWV